MRQEAWILIVLVLILSVFEWRTRTILAQYSINEETMITVQNITITKKLQEQRTELRKSLEITMFNGKQNVGEALALTQEKFSSIEADIHHSWSFLGSHHWTTDAWLGANNRDWRYYRKMDGPDFRPRNVTECERRVYEVLSLDTGFKPSPPEPHMLPLQVCEHYKRLTGLHLCRQTGTLSFVFKELGLTSSVDIVEFLESLRRLIDPYAHNGTVYYSTMHMQPETHPEWRWKGSTFLLWTQNNVRTFERAYGFPPLLIVDDQDDVDTLAAAGVNCTVIDSTHYWRNPFVAGTLRKLSRTVDNKYLWAYFILELGYTALFFDLDSTWFRPLLLPPPGQFDFVASVEAPGLMAERVTSRTEFPYDWRPLKRLYDLHEFHACPPHNDYIPLTSGIWAAYPSPMAFRFLSNYLELSFRYHDFWWEQNLWSYLLPHYAAFGARVAMWWPEAITGGNWFKMEDKHQCARISRTAFVHTKFPMHNFEMCKDAISVNFKHSDPAYDAIPNHPSYCINVLKDT